MINDRPTNKGNQKVVSIKSHAITSNIILPKTKTYLTSKILEIQKHFSINSPKRANPRNNENKGEFNFVHDV